VENERGSGEQPFWDLIQSRWSSFLLEATSESRRKGGQRVAPANPPCIACGEAIGDFQDPLGGGSPTGAMVMVKRKTRVGPFTQSEGLLFPFHRACLESARVMAEAEGLIWGDVDGRDGTPS
jgi:hypothetical protein